MGFSDLIGFTATMKETVSGTFNKMAAASQSAVNKVASGMANMRKSVNNVGSNVDTLNTKLDTLTKTRNLSINRRQIAEANREIERTQRQIDKLSGVRNERAGGGGGGGARFGWLGTAAVAASIGAGALGIAKAGSGMQQDLVGLSTFVGKSQANQVYANLQKDATVTPFVTKSLLQVDRALISAGVDADKAERDMMALANAVSAVGGGNDELSRMAVNMQQVKTQGKAMGMDIRQFAMAGINIYQLLADATGKPLSKVKDMTVSYDLLSFALEKAADKGGLYYNAMYNQSQTIQGKWSTLMDYIGIGMAKIGMSQSESIVALIDTFIGIAAKLPALAEHWAGAISNLVNNYLVPFVHTLIDVGQWLYNNGYWLKYVAGVVLVLTYTYKAAAFSIGLYKSVAGLLTTEIKGLTIAQWALNAATEAFPLMGMLALVGLVGFGIYKLMDKVKDANSEITNGVKSAVDNQEVIDTYANAGANSGKAFADAVGSKITDGIKSFRQFWKEQLGKMTDDIIEATGRMSKAKALYSFLPNSGNPNTVMGGDEGVYATKDFKQQGRVVVANLAGMLQQAGLGGGKEAFDKVASDARAQAATLRKYNVDISGKVNSIIAAQQKAIVSQANKMLLENNKAQANGGLYTGAIEEKGQKINSGGVRTVTINVGKLIDNFTIHTKNINEGVNNMDEVVAESLLRVLHGSAKMRE